VRLLFLSANPMRLELRADLEAQAIGEQLDRTSGFSLTTAWAAQRGELTSLLSRLQPSILHLSVHGRGAEIWFEDPAQEVDPVSLAELGAILRHVGQAVQCVVLSLGIGSSLSPEELQRLKESVPVVVAFHSEKISYSLLFSGVFYGLLVDGVSVGEATTSVGRLDYGALQLFSAPGVDPDQVTFVPKQGS